MLKPCPQHGGPGFPVSSTGETAPQVGHPVDRLAPRRGRRGGRRRPRAGARQGRPCLPRQPPGTRALRHGTAQPGRRKPAPGHPALERQTPLAALGRCPRAGCAATATVPTVLPDFPPSATGIPGQALPGLGGGVDGPRRQPPPLEGVRPGWRRRLAGWAHPEWHGRPPCALAGARRAAGPPPPRQRRRPRGRRAPPGIRMKLSINSRHKFNGFVLVA
jgi:hypothetical protein